MEKYIYYLSVYYLSTFFILRATNLSNVNLLKNPENYIYIYTIYIYIYISISFYDFI